MVCVWFPFRRRDRALQVPVGPSSLGGDRNSDPSTTAIASPWDGDPMAIAPETDPEMDPEMDPAFDPGEEDLPEAITPDRNTAIAPRINLLDGEPSQWWFWTLSIVALALMSATFGATLTLFLPLERNPLTRVQSFAAEMRTKRSFQYRLRQPLNLLVMGVDGSTNPDQPFGGRNDTVLLMRFDPAQETTSILAIPRDTAVDIPNLGRQRIAHANVHGGVPLLKKTLALNFNQVRIDRYARFHNAAFREFIDLLGGVELFVPKAMAYTDHSQRLAIALEPGWQTLDGASAEQFIRYRSDRLGDVGRVQRQQLLLQALRQRMASPAVMLELPQIAQLVQQYVDTDLQRSEVLALANFLLHQEDDRLRLTMLPGTFGPTGQPAAGQWLADHGAVDRLMADFFGIDRRGSVLRSSATSLVLQSNYLQANTRIAVQNASGQPDGAAAIVEQLRQAGFRQVTAIADWPEVLHQSQTIVQTGNIPAGEAVQRRLGTGRLVVAAVGDLGADLTVRVGTDLATP